MALLIFDSLAAPEGRVVAGGVNKEVETKPFRDKSGKIIRRKGRIK